MTDDAAFMEALRARPADDALRSIYADWLEENGDPRGEYLRIELQMVRLSKQGKKNPGLQDRQQALRVRIDPMWLAAMYELTWQASFERHGGSGFGGRTILFFWAVLQAHTGLRVLNDLLWDRTTRYRDWDDLALSAADLLQNPDVLKEAKRDFDERMKGIKYTTVIPKGQKAPKAIR